MGEESCREVLERSVVEKCWREMIGEESCREVFEKSVGEKCCRDRKVLEKRGVEMC